MKNLIPHLIHDQYLCGNEQGQFEAATLFVDISGFTALTSALMDFGDEGAELLSGILNKVFQPMVNAVYKRGGFITVFAGDAFTAIFPFNASNAMGFQKLLGSSAEMAHHALTCAQHIQTIFKREGVQHTKAGEFELAVKIGASAGRVDWGIVGDEVGKMFYFRGPAIDGCAAAENRSQKNQIVYDTHLSDHLKTEFVATHPIKLAYFRLDAIRSIARQQYPLHALKRPRLSRLRQNVVQLFQPRAAMDFDGGGEFRNVVSIFISFKGVSTHAELDQFASRLIRTKVRFGGYLKEIGFGDKGGVAIVFFGAPVSFEHNVERALNFILSLKRELAIASFKKWRAGITYGLNFAGIIGGRQRCQYSPLGDTVNLAARMMMQADWGEIQVNQRIQRYGHQLFDISHIADITYKGIAEPVPTFRVTDHRTVEDRTFDTALVGRQAELAQLVTWTQPILRETARFGGIITLYGEAGSGKSRLAYELSRTVGERVHWLTCQTDPILQKPFTSVIDLLNRYFEQRLEQSEETRKQVYDHRHARLIAQLEALPEYNTDHRLHNIVKELRRTYAILGAQIGLHWPRSLYEQLDAKGRHENMLMAFANLVKALATLQPTVILIEDGHWLDGESRAAVVEVIRAIKDHPLLVVTTMRYRDDGSRPQLLPREPIENETVPTHELDLAALTEADLPTLATGILGSPAAPELLDLLQRRTHGNPFFVEQMCLYLQENGLLLWEKKNARGSPRDPSPVGRLTLGTARFKLPDTINNLMVARIDRLSREVTEVVKTAAVIGPEFEIPFLSAVLQRMGATDLLTGFLDHVTTAEQERIWINRQDKTYTFRHALLREAAYHMQLKSRLRALHLVVAETMRQMYPDHPEYHADIAYHYDQAEQWGLALDFYDRAGDHAKDNFQNKEALAFFDRLLTLLNEQIVARNDRLFANKTTPSISEIAAALTGVDLTEDNARLIAHIIDALLKKTDILKMIGQLDETLALIDVTLPLAAYLDDSLPLCHLKNEKADILRRKGDYPPALTLANDVTQQLKDRPEEPVRKVYGHALNTMGLVYWNQGDYIQALQCYEEQKQICETIGDRRGYGSAVGNMGIVYDNQGEYRKALRCYEEFKQICEANGDRRGYGIAMGNMGIVYKSQRDYTRALRCYEEFKQICEAIGNRRGYGMAVGNMGNVYRDRGDYTRALPCYEELKQIAEDMGDRRGYDLTVGNMGIMYKNQGDYIKSLECYEELKQIAEKTGDRQAYGSAVGHMGELYSDQGQLNLALDCFEDTIAIHRELGAKHFLPPWLIGKARVLLNQQRYAVAQTCAAEGVAIATEVNKQNDLFAGQVLQAKIRFHSSIDNLQKEMEESIGTLEGILAKTDPSTFQGQEQQATLNYELRMMNVELNQLEITNDELRVKAEEHRQAALELYQTLYEKTPKFEYKKRIEELST